jgi:hypothetical protein
MSITVKAIPRDSGTPNAEAEAEALQKVLSRVQPADSEFIQLVEALHDGYFLAVFRHDSEAFANLSVE